MADYPYSSVLITGGAGFIGSHLAEALIARGCHVTIIDDLSTGAWRNIAHLSKRTEVRVVVASADERELIDSEVPRHDLVFHLAGAVGVRLIVDRPVHTLQSIVGATDIVLQACRRYRCPCVITSTSEVYGKSEHTPFSEGNDVVMGPTEKRRWAYACAKALDEFLAFAHYGETSLPVYVTRLFNTVGPRQTGQYGMVVPNFIQQALRNAPLHVHGDGRQARCFCHVDDAVDGLVRLPTAQAAMGHVVNLGSQEEITIADLAEKVVARTGSRSEIAYIPYEEAFGANFDDMRRRIPDLTRARDWLGWQPQTHLDDIVDSVVASFETAANSRPGHV